MFTIYGSTISPYVRKAHALALLKGVAFESRNIGLGSKDEAFRAASPFGMIPAMDHDGYLLSDSSAIAHYLEALVPEPALIPAEPRARGRTIQLEEFADTVLFGTVQKMFFNRVVRPRFQGKPGDLALADKAEAEDLPPLLDWLETQIDGPCLVGDRISLADIAVASPFANAGYAGLVLDPARWPRLAAWAPATLALPCFAAALAMDARLLAKTAR